jgi:hypothetical protein
VDALSQGGGDPLVKADGDAEEKRLAPPDEAGWVSKLKDLKRAAGAFLKDLMFFLRLSCALWIVRRRLREKGRGKRIRWMRRR